MQIVFFSKTHNIARFIKKTGLDAIEGYPDLVINEPFVLVSYSKGFGETPIEVTTFLEHSDNKNYLSGIFSSGNKNWGKLYCKSGYDLAKKYDVDLLMTFELAGNQHDVNKFIKIMEELNA